MLTMEELRNRPDILGEVDWEITPQQAFEAYQIKSINAHRHRNLKDAVYFEIYVHQGRAVLKLVRRTYKDSEDLALLPAPPELIQACLDRQAGAHPPHGHYQLDADVIAWIRRSLGI